MFDYNSWKRFRGRGRLRDDLRPFARRIGVCERDEMKKTVSAILFAVILSAGASRALAAAAAQETISDILKSPILKGTTVAVVIHDLEEDRYLFEQNRAKVMIPASNMKLVTGAAAILSLGLSWRFHTDVFADSFDPKTGAVGNLFIYGRGDPTLSGEFYPTTAAAIDSFVGEIALMGVRSVTGDIILDDSYFPPQDDPEWPAEDLNYCYAPRTGALSVGENCLKVTATGGSGGLVSVQFDPPVPARFVKVNVGIGRKGGASVKVSRQADGVYVVSGRVGKGRTAEGEFRMANPSELFGMAVAGGFARVGVAFKGRIINANSWQGDREKFKHIARFSSAPLADIISEMEMESDNFVAEQMLRIIGAQRGNEGTTRAGSRAAMDLMKQFKLAGDGEIDMRDGSGLSRLNRLTPAAMDRLLESFYKSYVGESFFRMLATPGGRGTMKKRLVGSAAEGRLWAKTGALKGVCSLSGYYVRGNGNVASFVMFFNGYSVHSNSIRELQDRIVKVMMRM